MHEMAISQSLLEQVRSFLPPGSLLREVRIEVGELEHLEEEVLRTAWTVLTDGSPLAGATLSVTRIGLLVRCKACGREYEPEDVMIMICPKCGATQPEIIRGSGVLLRSLSVDEYDEPDGA